VDANREYRLRVAPKIFDFLSATKKRINLVYGGAGSSKSWQIALYLIFKIFLIHQRVRILIIRKTMPSLKKSCWRLILDRLNESGIRCEVNKTDFTIRFGSNEILFVSLDDAEKLKSIEGINYVWVEEATEITFDEFKQINLRCRGKNESGVNQLFYSFNPCNWMHFLRHLTENPPENIGVCHSTHEDNPFLDDDYRQEIRHLSDIDDAYAAIYRYGKWAQLRGRIYEHFQPCQNWPGEFDEVRYGLDFGFNNPTALLQIGIRDQDLYLRELLYEKGMTNQEVIGQLEELGIDKEALIVADAAEPNRIREIYLAGYDCQPARKEPDSVRRGIDVIKSRTVYYEPSSTNLYGEYSLYKWKEDRDGNIIAPEQPVKINDHLMDALRYAIYFDAMTIGVDVSNDEPFRGEESVGITVGDEGDVDDWEGWEDWK